MMARRGQGPLQMLQRLSPLPPESVTRSVCGFAGGTLFTQEGQWVPPPIVPLPCQKSKRKKEGSPGVGGLGGVVAGGACVQLCVCETRTRG